MQDNLLQLELAGMLAGICWCVLIIRGRAFCWALHLATKNIHRYQHHWTECHRVYCLSAALTCCTSSLGLIPASFRATYCPSGTSWLLSASLGTFSLQVVITDLHFTALYQLSGSDTNIARVQPSLVPPLFATCFGA